MGTILLTIALGKLIHRDGIVLGWIQFDRILGFELPFLLCRTF